MQSPNCREELRETEKDEHGSVVLDVCPSCEGAWFDKGELDSEDV